MNIMHSFSSHHQLIDVLEKHAQPLRGTGERLRFLDTGHSRREGKNLSCLAKPVMARRSSTGFALKLPAALLRKKVLTPSRLRPTGRMLIGLIDLYRGVSDDTDADEALSDFERFPTWMWRNTEVLAFVEWLRGYKERIRTGTPMGSDGVCRVLRP